MNGRHLALSGVLILVLAGCTGPADDPLGTSTETVDTQPGLKYYEHPSLGPILADSDGRTLYVFTNDEPGLSKCYGGCANAWPPYITSAVPPAPTEIRPKLNLTSRNGGDTQLAYRGMPLYYWANDKSPGDAMGDGVNGIWFVVRKPPTNNQMPNGKGSHEVQGQDVTYSGPSRGYHAKAQGLQSGRADVGIVMIHEWWGLNENIREMARILASHGYQVLAVDLFNGTVATTSQQAQAQVQALNQSHATRNLRDAAQYLRGQGAERIATLGWCFGGGQSLQLSLSGEPLVATIIYYGFLDTNQDNLSRIDWPVLGIFGEKDPVISVPTVRAFENALKNNSIENDIYIYPEVGHAFANPSGNAWAPEETQDAWRRTLRFLDEHTGG